jgi:hypothetical protein
MDTYIRLGTDSFTPAVLRRRPKISIQIKYATFCVHAAFPLRLKPE